MRGKGIKRAFRQTAANNVIPNIVLRLRMIQTNPANKGADIIDGGLLKGTWWDITTIGAWGKHVCIGLFY